MTEPWYERLRTMGLMSGPKSLPTWQAWDEQWDMEGREAAELLAAGMAILSRESVPSFAEDVRSAFNQELRRLCIERIDTRSHNCANHTPCPYCGDCGTVTDLPHLRYIRDGLYWTACLGEIKYTQAAHCDRCNVGRSKSGGTSVSMTAYERANPHWMSQKAAFEQYRRTRTHADHATTTDPQAQYPDSTDMREAKSKLLKLLASKVTGKVEGEI
jgi:hypothetical protein